MILLKSRRERERIIVLSMIRMYCRGVHETRDNLCPECKGISHYTSARLEYCLYGDEKPVCKDCPVHCYSAPNREKMRAIMRWAGPRMIYRQPVYAALHILDSLMAPKPVFPPNKSR